MPLHRTLPRRHFLRSVALAPLAGGAAAAHASLGSAPGRASGRPGGVRELALHHTHTGERIALVYAEGGRYEPQALLALNRFLRDHYSGEVGVIDPALLDQLYSVRRLLGSAQPFQVISGYRAERTNNMLRLNRGGGVARQSLHMEGRAIDVRLAGVRLADLQRAALSLNAGGVGYYPHDGFVHLDTGAVRQW